MSKVSVGELKINDVVSIDANEIPGYVPAMKLSGVVRNIFDQNLGYERFKFVELFTEQGIKGAYLNFTDSVVKTILSEEDQLRLRAKPMIRSLRRKVAQQGSDPEIFIVNQDNNIIPAFRFLKSKEEPNRIPENHQPLFWDGFQAEFNLSASSCLDSTLYSVWYGLKHLNKLAKGYDKNARLTVQNTFDVPRHMLLDEKPEHVAFGCMPSYNVYDMFGIKADGRDVSLRSAGGHIHLQLDSAQKKKIPQYVKALDAILGVATVSMFGSIDNPDRRQYYGLAGEYRTPKHGLEYRTLSNAWMCHPTVTYIIFELARKVISLVDSDMFQLWKYNEADTIECINTCNIPLAFEILKMNEEMFKDILHSFCYNRPDTVDAVYASFMTGVENLITNVDDIENNWNLNGHCTTPNLRISNLPSNNPNFGKLSKMKI